MAKKIRNLLNEIDKKFKESEEVSTILYTSLNYYELVLLIPTHPQSIFNHSYQISHLKLPKVMFQLFG